MPRSVNATFLRVPVRWRATVCDTSAMRTFLVVNPESAGGATGRRWPEIRAEVLRAIGDGAEHAFTDHPMHAATLTAEALRQGFPSHRRGGRRRHPQRGGERLLPGRRGRAARRLPRARPARDRRGLPPHLRSQRLGPGVLYPPRGRDSDRSTSAASASPGPTAAPGSATSSTSPASGSAARWTAP